MNEKLSQMCEYVEAAIISWYLSALSHNSLSLFKTVSLIYRLYVQKL